MLLIFVVGFSSLMPTHLVSAKTILDAQNAVLSDLPSILGTLYKKKELNKLLLTCFDGSHQYSTQGAYQRLQGTSNDVHQDAAADFHLPPCLENFLYGEKNDNCNHMQNNSWYAILKDEFAGVALHELKQENGNDTIFLEKICSSWMRLLELQGLTDESKGFGNHAETTALIIPELLERMSSDKAGESHMLNANTGIGFGRLTKRDLFAERGGGSVASGGGFGGASIISLFAAFAALGAALLLAISTSSTTATTTTSGNTTNGSPVTITANSPNSGTVNINTAGG